MCWIQGFRPLLLALAWGCLFARSQSDPDEVSALSAFKKAIYEDPRSILSNWNAQDANPCGWLGVICAFPQNHVISINLPNSSLTGFLTPALGSLSYLQELVLNDNELLGPIPEEIGMLKSLTLLNLSSNQLSGPIPPAIGDLTSILKLDLHSNMLTGTIPSELGKLVSMVELRMDKNMLTGVIPGNNSSQNLSSEGKDTGLCQLSQLKDANFSFNMLVGEIPKCFRRLPRLSFEGNCFNDGDYLNHPAQKCANGQQITEETYSNPREKHKHNKRKEPLWLLILEIITGTIFALFLITYIVGATKRCKSKSSTVIPPGRSTSWKDQTVIPINEDLLKGVLKVSRQELEVACEDFSNIIGSSSDAVVYKGTMKAGPEIAVISLCILEDCWTSSVELYFQKEVADLARINHENIAKLLGYCNESNPFSRMLILEYASNGTLCEHLHYGDGCQMSWPRRMRIALGIAYGLRYLHTELQPPFAIAELTSSAVYLTEDFSPKLVDFERWKTILSKPGMNTGCVVNGGLFHSYIDSRQRRYMDVQANTFAFGVILLELISGRPAFCKERGCLVDWALQYLGDPQDISKLVDPELKNVKPETLSVVCNAVSLCLEHEPTKRPSMQIITAVLEAAIETLPAAVLKDTPLAWAELVVSTAS
ncbi:probable LRR receptor-like serine/threonine-protein kinase At1g63430 [Ananas comosus]|uniref:Probable LRR receptor-like serine/threonine-protein kinase At1g63430 n=1 Tax=Ananas comosus TaxID=4615 RepID=A0A6P5FDK0_ANACO|nr:probable LRR receptor-like serine/threonine-protein kinase At1g63430 [Ananas comosus]